MARDHLEFGGIAVAFHAVSVAVAFGFGQSKRASGDEFLDGNAVSIESNIASLCLCDGEKIPANAGQADRLCWRSARIGRRHFLRGEVKNAKRHGDEHEEADELAHGVSVNL